MSSSPADASKKVTSSRVKAPSQFNQPSRKRKAAWRKNIDVEDVDEGLEKLRAEEVVMGLALEKKRDDELFQIDVKGDERIRRFLPRFSRSELTSSKNLSQRSALPPVSSRVVTKRKAQITQQDKIRLLRVARRPRIGPFGALVKPEKFAGEVTEAVKHSGTYDLWSMNVDQLESPEVVAQTRVKVQAPRVPQIRALIELPAVEKPHPGTSYNPSAISHQELVMKAYSLELERLRQEEKSAEVKEKMDHANLEAVEAVDGLPLGMTLDVAHDSDEDWSETQVDAVPRRSTKPKTTKQRKKAAMLLEQKRSLAAKAAQQRLLASVSSIKALRRREKQARAESQRVAAQRQQVELEKLKHGMAGKKLGRHRVPQSVVDVQLGGDLTESFRALKPEGDLFRDRLMSLQHRALVEPRAPVLKRTRKTKEYEKHAWKRFEREQY